MRQPFLSMHSFSCLFSALPSDPPLKIPCRAGHELSASSVSAWHLYALVQLAVEVDPSRPLWRSNAGGPALYGSADLSNCRRA